VEGGRWRGSQHLNVIRLEVAGLGEAPFTSRLREGTRIAV